MIELLVSLCLQTPEAACFERLIPVSAPDCPAAMAAGEARLAAWRESYEVSAPACIETPRGGLAFQEIAPGVHVHRGSIAEAGPDNLGDISNVAFVVGAESVAVIDSGGSRAVGEEIYLAVRGVSDLPISHVILSHFHPDHVYGATALVDAGATIVGHAKLGEALAARTASYRDSMTRLIGAGFAGSAAVAPELTVSEARTIDLGRRPLRLEAWPLAHTAADLTVLDVTTGTLIAGDLVFDTHTPALDGSLLGWQRALATLSQREYAAVVPGHGGPRLDWPAGAAPQRRYLQVLEEQTRAAIEAGTGLGEAAESVAAGEAGDWALFDLFNPRNATAAYTELEWE